MTLRLRRLAPGGRTEFSLTGVLSTRTERQHVLMELARCAQDAGLCAVLCVDGDVDGRWCAEWTDALEAVQQVRQVRFELSSRCSSGGRRDE